MAVGTNFGSRYSIVDNAPILAVMFVALRREFLDVLAAFLNSLIEFGHDAELWGRLLLLFAPKAKYRHVEGLQVVIVRTR